MLSSDVCNSPHIPRTIQWKALAKVTHHYWIPGLDYLLSLIGLMFKVEDNGCTFYVNKERLIQALTINLRKDLKNEALKSERVALRTLEILNPVIGESAIAMQKLQTAASQILPDEVTSIEKLIQKMETIRDARLPHLTQDIDGIKRTLQPGDLLFRKYHEDNPNPICDLQRYFRWLSWGKIEREAYKISHVALYLGNGEVAEAVMPRDQEPQVRIISMDHARCMLAPKNQYIVARPANALLGQKAAEVFRSFATPFNGAEEKTGKDGGKVVLKYSYIEALRSLWHPTNFDYFAKVRYLKYYADYVDNATPTHIVLPRQLFCSYAVSLAYQVADGITERATAPKTLYDIVGHSWTKGYNQWTRTLVRGIWARFHAIWNGSELNRFVQLKYDALRANPQDMRNYVLHHPEQFQDIYILDSNGCK